MKTNQRNLILPIVILTMSIMSCANNQNPTEFERLKIWEDIRVAAKEKRIDYLLEISKDTLDCIECNSGESWIIKKEFFNNHLKQIEVSNNKEYSIYSEKYEDEKGFTKRYRINYTYEIAGKEEGYNAIYTILTGEKGIQFQGVFGVP